MGGAACRRRLGWGWLARGCARGAGTGVCSVRLGRQWVCDAEPAAGSMPGVQPLAPPPLLAVLATYLAAPAGGLPNLPAHSLAGCWFPRVRGSWEAARKSPSAPPPRSLLSATRVAEAVGRDCRRGVVLGGCYSGGGEKSAPCHSSLPSGRAWGECRRPQVRPGFPQLRGPCPQPAPRSRQPRTGWSRGRRAGRGLARRPGRGRGQAGAGQGGGDLGTPVLFHRGGRGGLLHAS